MTGFSVFEAMEGNLITVALGEFILPPVYYVFLIPISACRFKLARRGTELRLQSV
jgi:hypothetical protein